MYDTPKPTTPTKRVVSLATTTAITSTPPPAQHHHHRLQELVGEEGGGEQHHLVTPLTWVRDTAHVFRDLAATTSPPHLTMTSDENPFVCDESMMMTSSPVTPEDGAEDVMSTVSSLSNGSLRIMSNIAPAGEEAEDGMITTSPPPHEIRILRVAPKEEFEYQVPDWLRELATCSHESSLSSSAGAAPLPPPPCLSHVSPSLPQTTTTTAKTTTTTTLRPVLETTTNMLLSPLNNHSNRKLTLSYANGKLVAQRANNPTSMNNDMPQQQHQKQLNSRRQPQQLPSYGASPSCSPVGCAAANNNNYSAVAITTPPGCCSEDPLLGNRPRRRQRREVSATFSVGSIVGQSSWVTPSASYGAYGPEGSTTTSSTTLDQMSSAAADEPISYTNVPADYNAQSLEVQRQQMRAYHALNEYAAASAAAAAAAGGDGCGGVTHRKKGRRNITNPVREDIKHVWGCVASPIIRRHNNNKHHHHHGGAGGGGCGGGAGGDNRVNLKRASGCLT